MVIGVRFLVIRICGKSARVDFSLSAESVYGRGHSCCEIVVRIAVFAKGDQTLFIGIFKEDGSERTFFRRRGWFVRENGKSIDRMLGFEKDEKPIAMARFGRNDSSNCGGKRIFRHISKEHLAPSAPLAVVQ